jgi:hypothetical protein
MIEDPVFWVGAINSLWGYAVGLVVGWQIWGRR